LCFAGETFDEFNEKKGAPPVPFAKKERAPEVIYEIAQQFLAGLLGNLKPEMVAPPSGSGNAMRRFTILCD
jgi:hypothetical protein